MPKLVAARWEKLFIFKEKLGNCSERLTVMDGTPGVVQQ